MSTSLDQMNLWADQLVNQTKAAAVKSYRLPIYKVALVRESSQVCKANHINNPDQAYQILKQYLDGADREHFVIAMLDVKKKVIGIHTVSVGLLSNAPVHPREVFKSAILANAASIILAHNHPSGDSNPSRDDLALTQRLCDVGGIVGIPVVDHIILGDDNFKSLKEMGVM
jgi:DNA repair protein RadC